MYQQYYFCSESWSHFSPLSGYNPVVLSNNSKISCIIIIGCWQLSVHSILFRLYCRVNDFAWMGISGSEVYCSFQLHVKNVSIGLHPHVLPWSKTFRGREGLWVGLRVKLLGVVSRKQFRLYLFLGIKMPDLSGEFKIEPKIKICLFEGWEPIKWTVKKNWIFFYISSAIHFYPCAFTPGLSLVVWTFHESVSIPVVKQAAIKISFGTNTQNRTKGHCYCRAFQPCEFTFGQIRRW